MNVVQRITEHDPDKIAFICKGRNISYGELVTLVNKTAGHLKHFKGVVSVMAIDVQDGLNSIIVRLALTQLGIQPVPLNLKMGVFEVQTRWMLSKAQHLIADYDTPNPFNLPCTALVDLETLINDSEPVTDYAPGGESPMFVCWSGGTHGTPDALTHSHDSIITMANYSKIWAGDWPNQKIYVMAPMSTAFFSMYLGIHLYLGGTMVIDAGQFNPMTVANTIIENQVTHIGTTPAIYSLLLRRNSLTKEQVPSVCLVAGDAVPAQLVRAWESKYDITLRTCLASSQTGPVTFRLDRNDPVDSVGRLLEGIELRLTDEDGNTVPEGQPGKAWFRSPQNAMHEASNNSPSLVDGWITTHDILRITPDRLVYWVGRGNDTFKVNGYFVNPKKIEDRVRDIPGIQDAAAVAQVDENGLKRVKVYAVTTDAAVDKDQLAHDIREMVADLESHERVRHVEFIDEIPRHPMSQKVQKFRLQTSQ